MNLLSLLLGSMTQSSSVDSLSKKSGVSQQLVKALIIAAIPMILKSMTQNASSEAGAASLLGALGQHKDKKDLADQLGGADAEDGGKIINHIFGGNTSSVISQLAGETGMKEDQVNSVLSNMAPAIMSTLSATQSAGSEAQQAGNSFDLGSFAGSDLMSGLFGGSTAASQGANLLSSLLSGQSAGADTSAMDGSALLGSLLGLRK